MKYRNIDAAAFVARVLAWTGVGSLTMLGAIMAFYLITEGGE